LNLLLPVDRSRCAYLQVTIVEGNRFKFAQSDHSRVLLIRQTPADRTDDHVAKFDRKKVVAGSPGRIDSVLQDYFSYTPGICILIRTLGVGSDCSFACGLGNCRAARFAAA
jgi:hypothetical protein